MMVGLGVEEGLEWAEGRQLAYFIDGADSEGRGISSRGLVYPDSRWNRPDEHVHQRVSHHLV